MVIRTRRTITMMKGTATMKGTVMMNLKAFQLKVKEVKTAEKTTKAKTTKAKTTKAEKTIVVAAPETNRNRLGDE
jgi:hypothetical protein